MDQACEEAAPLGTIAGEGLAGGAGDAEGGGPVVQAEASGCMHHGWQHCIADVRYSLQKAFLADGFRNSGHPSVSTITCVDLQQNPQAFNL